MVAEVKEENAGGAGGFKLSGEIKFRGCLDA